MDRFDTLSEFVDAQSDKILEIGALDRPLFDPSRFRVSFMDRLDSQGIREAFYPTDDEFALVLRKAPKKEPADWDIIAQQLARQAGYSADFGGGKLRLALNQDPELLARFEHLQRSWREENALSPL